MIDIDEPDVSVYNARSTPMVSYPGDYSVSDRCACIRTAVSSPTSDAVPERYSFSFAFNPPWDPNWTIEERRKEECRRICWSALNLIANYTAQCAAFHQDPIELHLMEPANVSKAQ
jgi:hypothetical protein